MAREPVVMALGTGRWRAAYEAMMIVLALAVVALLPMRDEGIVRVVNLSVWAVFVLDYFVRLALSTDRRGFVRRNVVDLVAILPADFFRATRVLRVARLFRVVRAGSILWRVTRDLRGVLRTNALGWVLAVSGAVIFADRHRDHRGLWGPFPGARACPCRGRGPHACWHRDHWDADGFDRYLLPRGTGRVEP